MNLFTDRNERSVNGKRHRCVQARDALHAILGQECLGPISCLTDLEQLGLQQRLAQAWPNWPVGKRELRRLFQGLL